MKNAVIFDLDGTLWDATEKATEVWNRVLLKHSEADLHVDRKTISELMGKQLTDIVRILFPALQEEKRQQILKDFERTEVQHLYEYGATLYAGVKETVVFLYQKYDLFIVSNCQDGYVSAFLYAHNLTPYFKDAVMSGQTGLEKGSNIKNLMKKHGIRKAVYVGDTAGDENASKEAGIPFIWARYGFGTAINPDGIISTISELKTCVERYI